MRSNLFVTGLTIALGFMTPIGSAIVFPEMTVAQTVDPRKVEADRLLEQGTQQFKTSHFEVALQSWEKALVLEGTSYLMMLEHHNYKQINSCLACLPPRSI